MLSDGDEVQQETKRNPLRRGLATLSALALAASGIVLGASIPGAVAYATPDTVAEAKAELDAIQAEITEIQEGYSAATEKLERSEAARVQAIADLAVQQEKVDNARSALGHVVRNTQQNDGIHVTVKMLTSPSIEEFLSNVATVQSVSSITADRLARFDDEKARLVELETTLNTAIAEVATQKANQEDLLADFEVKEADAEQILNRLTAEEQERLMAQRAADAERRAQQAANSQALMASAGVAPSERAGAALAFAMAQIGKPYIWGGTGPDGYDCSGLMYAAYRAAGVSIPRTSQAQYSSLTNVSMGDLQPGDLVFYYSGISHVAMYIGSGQVVHSPNFGQTVTIMGVYSWPVAGAARVAG